MIHTFYASQNFKKSAIQSSNKNLLDFIVNKHKKIAHLLFEVEGMKQKMWQKFKYKQKIDNWLRSGLLKIWLFADF